MNTKRMKPITEEQSKKAVAHWRRALTQKEARAASEAVKKAFADAGVEADVSGPMTLAKGESSIFGRVYRYSAGKCPLWGSAGFCSMGFASPYVVARLRKPVKRVRSSLGSTVRDLTEIRVKVELTAGHLTYESSNRKGADPREDYAGVRGTRARTEKIDADPRWECEVWDANIYTDGSERAFRRHGWFRYQPSSTFVYSPTQEGLHGKIAAQIDWIARDLRIGKYAKAR
jgi:hypothetical protein